MFALSVFEMRILLFFLCIFVRVSCGDVVLLGTHADALAQTTEVGRTLHTLEVADDKLLIGYGDYGADTGPISIRYFDTTSSTFSDSLGIANTEAIFHIQTIDTKAYALSTDPLMMGPGGYLSGNTQTAAPWSPTESLAGVHFYGMTSYKGDAQHLFLVGSGGPTARTNAMVYESLDGGTNWTTSLDLAAPNDVSGVNFLRLYGIAELENSLFVQPMGLGSSKVAMPLYEFDGTDWKAKPTPRTTDGQTTEFFDPDTLGDTVIVRSNHSGFQLSPAYLFDGDSLDEIVLTGSQGTLSFWDQFATHDTLYLLTNENSVVASSDLTEWKIVADNVPDTARSLAVINDDLFFGTTESTLYRSSITSIPEPNAGSLTLLAMSLIPLLVSRRKSNRSN